MQSWSSTFLLRSVEAYFKLWSQLQLNGWMMSAPNNVQLGQKVPGTISIANVLSSLRLTASDTWVDRTFVWVSGKKERWHCWLPQNFGLSCTSLGMDSTKVIVSKKTNRVSKETNRVSLKDYLQSHYSWRPEAKVSLQVLGNRMHEVF